MDQQQKAASSVNVFYSYATEDEKLQHKLEKHLNMLRRQGLISDWHPQKIVAGSNREQSINSHLESASLILLLISPDFLASDYCYGVEMQRAMERHRAGLAVVIPILLRPVDWQGAPFAALQFLPRNGKPIVQWSNLDAALLTIAEEIRATVDALGNSAEISGSHSIVAQPVQDQNRQRFLKRVRATWVEGVLEHSLFNATLITLGLHELPEAVANPWHLLVQETRQPPRQLPATTHITEIYDEADGELLILGEPGAGKTTLVLELARDLLTRAEYRADHPLPAIFNLSSWAEKRQPLAAWLCEELHDRYQVPRKLGAAWIADNQLLPLLDGLDEVAPVQRAACIEAINHYQQEHSLVPLVVSSRHAEYVAQPTRIILQKSVLVQPLTAQQIDAYLLSAGEQVAAVRMAIGKDADLRELATTPLLLNVLMLTYQGTTPDELIASKSPELLRRQIFAQYVTRMLQRRGVDTRYTPQQTGIWLANLARQMKRHGRTEFYIERIKRDWLVDQGAKLFYGISTTLICVLAGILVGWIVIALIGGLTAGLLQILFGLLSFGFIGGLISVMNPEMQPTDAFIWSWDIIRKEWAIVLLLTFVGGLAGILDIKQSNELLNILTLKFADLLNILLSMIAGIMFGGFIGVLLSGLQGGLKVMTDMHRIIKPNQEIWRSARNSFSIIAISMVFVFLFLPFSRPGIILAGTFGLAGALGFGGLACIQHAVLRYQLWSSGQMPWGLPRFLDYAAERILLRKVGGGYIFVHRLLLDHFAGVGEDGESNHGGDI